MRPSGSPLFFVFLPPSTAFLFNPSIAALVQGLADRLPAGACLYVIPVLTKRLDAANV